MSKKICILDYGLGNIWSLKNSIEFNDLFNKNFTLNSKIEDITYKSFALETLGQWLNIYQHFQETGEWKATANEN